MKISHKIFASFLAIIVVLVGMGSYSMVSTRNVERLNRELDKANENLAFFIEKEVDHLRWLNNLNNMFLSGQAVDNIDHTECDLGKWYYSNDPEDYYRDAFIDLEAPHIATHESSRRVIDLFEAGRREEALSVLQNETVPAVEGVQRELSNLESIARERISELLMEIDRVGNRLNRISMILMLLSAIVTIIIAYGLSRSIVRPIKHISGTLDRIANYDLTILDSEEHDSYRNRSDEIGHITRSADSMQENLRELVLYIDSESDKVSSSSEELTALSGQASKASEEVSLSIDGIAQGAGDQARDTEMGALKTEELNQMIEEDLEDMKSIGQSVESLSKLKDDGIKSMADLTSKTDNSNRAIRSIYESTKNTDDSALKIGEASKIIEGISEQTNLLALNAAIEAARAGEGGKGFAVVAEEIRQLAEQSTESVKSINDMLEKLQNNSRGAVEVMESVLKTIDEQVESVKLTEERFGGIATEIDTVKSIVAKSEQSVQNMRSKKDELAVIMENLSAISEENAAGSQETSAFMEQQTASMQEIAKSSEDLAELAETMRNRVSKFNL